MQDKQQLIKLASDRKKIPLEQAEKEINAIFKEKTEEYTRRLALAHYFVDQTHPNHKPVIGEMNVSMDKISDVEAQMERKELNK